MGEWFKKPNGRNLFLGNRQQYCLELLVNVPNFINVNILERVNMTYLIKPFESIGDFVFGTSLEEIQEKYGKPARIVEDNMLKIILWIIRWNIGMLVS